VRLRHLSSREHEDLKEILKREKKERKKKK